MTTFHKSLRGYGCLVVALVLSNNKSLVRVTLVKWENFSDRNSSRDVRTVQKPGAGAGRPCTSWPAWAAEALRPAGRRVTVWAAAVIGLAAVAHRSGAVGVVDRVRLARVRLRPVS